MSQTSRPPWLGIELRHLAALSAIAREGSFHAAADRLGYVQSAISQQLAHLEHVVGSRLVDRRRGVTPIALTEAGELLLHHSDAIMARFNAAQADIEALASGRAGRLRVGVYEPVTSRLVPGILTAFVGRFPAVDIHLEEGAADDLATAVQTGRVDVAFCQRPVPAGPFESRDLLEERYVLLVPSDWPVARARRAPSAEELGHMPLAGPPGDGISEQLGDAMRASGVELRYAFGGGSHAAIRALVDAGIAAAVVGALSVDERDDRTVALDLGELLPPRQLAVYWHRDRQRLPTLSAFLDLAHAACADQERSERPALVAA